MNVLRIKSGLWSGGEKALFKGIREKIKLLKSRMKESSEEEKEFLQNQLEELKKEHRESRKNRGRLF